MRGSVRDNLAPERREELDAISVENIVEQLLQLKRSHHAQMILVSAAHAHWSNLSAKATATSHDIAYLKGRLEDEL